MNWKSRLGVGALFGAAMFLEAAVLASSHVDATAVALALGIGAGSAGS